MVFGETVVGDGGQDAEFLPYDRMGILSIRDGGRVATGADHRK